MSNLAVQNASFDKEEAHYDAAVRKAQAIAPSDEISKAPKKAQGAFRTISEVADDLDVQQHVLRFWETKFNQIKPLKRGGGRRYYRPEDVALLKHIHHLLYTEGYTIKGVQKLLKGQGKNQIAAQVMEAEVQVANAMILETPKVASNEQAEEEGADSSSSAIQLSDRQRSALEGMLAELKALRSMFPAEAA